MQENIDRFPRWQSGAESRPPCMEKSSFASCCLIGWYIWRQPSSNLFKWLSDVSAKNVSELRKQQSINPCLSKVIHRVYIDQWVGGDLDYYMIYIADQQPVYQVTVNENSNSDNFTSSFGTFWMTSWNIYKKFCHFHIFPAFTNFWCIFLCFSCYRPSPKHCSK